MAVPLLMSTRKARRGWAYFNENRSKFEVPLSPWHVAQLRQFEANRRLITLNIRG